jgi:hypothetical protein
MGIHVYHDFLLVAGDVEKDQKTWLDLEDYILIQSPLSPKLWERAG